MELTEKDLGRTVLWLSGSARLATIVQINPADDEDVLVAPDSGGKVWVHPAGLFPIQGDSNPTAIVALVNIAQDLTDYDKLKAHVREFLAAVDALAPQVITGWSREAGDAFLKLRQDVE